MRIVGDYSDWQYGADLDAAAQAVDAAWFKWVDWSYWAGHGEYDWLHDDGLKTFANHGKPAGTYLFCRPGWTDPKTQVDTWAANCLPLVTMSPMLDLEVPGSLSGGSLTAWVDEALYWMTDRWGRKPTLYWSERFQSENGMGTPQTEHFCQVAEYHRGYRSFLWADLAGWEPYAYSAYGGPGVPAGEPGYHIWQFTSSAQVPGFGGLTDMSFVFDNALAEMTGAGVGNPEELTMADVAALQAQIEAARVNILTDMGTYIGSVYTRVDQAEDLVIAELGRVRDLIIASLPDDPGSPGGVPFETVKGAVDQLGQVTTGLQRALPVTLATAKSLDDPELSPSDRAFGRLVQRVSQLPEQVALELAKHKGEITPEMVREATDRFVAGAANSTMAATDRDAG